MVSSIDVPARRSEVVLTARDVALLEFIAAYRAAPLDLLAKRFFDVDPYTGRVNAKPEHACRRRLQILAAAGVTVQGWA
jgi:hypothetical protein